MKKIIIILSVIISVNAYANKKSICDGWFKSGQSVHVVVDWDNQTVDVNQFKTYIQSVTSFGIVTGTYSNKLGIETFSIIGHIPKAGTFVAQSRREYGQITFTNFARLTCSRSFYKAFTDSMLDG